ncbi:hypothetical protein DNU06_08785 [Putridiphycobacter roseus]|uniref:Peptidase S8/S53 domain-containing protein n=1 Tax=Putridiphycobacter roseus TaxID=2219161 RepID=A0A2W1NH83_9FLAO|nr:S8 family peptidase [Putridiphycobacter roseus]PZE17356.1 hypothetical protein DNU06_08785 [Putridiphycobacter roseus]
MKKYIVIAVLMITHFSFGQIKMSQNCKFDLNFIETQYKSNAHKLDQKLLHQYPIYYLSNRYYLAVLVKIKSNFNKNELKALNVMLGGQVGTILSLKIPLDAVVSFLELKGIETLQIAGKIKPTLNKLLVDTKVDSVHRGLGLPEIYSGKDVLIGITDWGFDYSSPMFYDTLLQDTRILAAWDQFKTSGPHPSNFNYGTEYASAIDLANAAADTANIYSYATHGSHVAGIAGGSGAGTVFRGVAYEANYLMVTFLVDESAVLDAWEWMYEKALQENKRLVINMSWGLYHTGALDGTSLLSQALDNYAEQGVVFVTSGGNNGDVDFHVKHDFLNDSIKTRVNFYSGATNNLWGQSIHGWGDAGNSFEARFSIVDGSGQVLNASPWYNTSTLTNYIDSIIVVGNDTVAYNLSMDASYPTNGRPQMRLRIKKPGVLRIVLESTAPSGTVHFWNVTELSTDVGNWGMDFTAILPDYLAGDANYGIGAPACSGKAITVAAHSAAYANFNGTIYGGQKANFSSVGPLMNGNLKPDISAPGVSVASSISSYTDNGFSQITSVNFNNRTYPFARFSGTSMSSPAVAGIVALMLQANPFLSPYQVKNIIIQTRRLDEHTGMIGPNGDVAWGHGKINALKAIKVAVNTVGVLEVAQPIDWKVYPNPTHQILYIEGLTESVKEMQIINLNGQVIASEMSNNKVNVADLLPGFYVLRVQFENKVEQTTFIVE